MAKHGEIHQNTTKHDEIHHKLTQPTISVVRYPRYLDTYGRYLRDDTSIANVTIYRGIS